jgi:hypothetical protein
LKHHRKSFLLRLPPSIHDEAEELANRDGISLNQFITLALTEKLTRLEMHGKSDNEKSVMAGQQNSTPPRKLPHEMR